MIVHAHLVEREQKKRMVLSYDVEKEIKEKGMSIDGYLTEMLMLNPQFNNSAKNHIT